MRGYNEVIRSWFVYYNSTSNCTQLYFVETIRKNFMFTDGTGSCCNGELHSLLTSCSGLRSVFWTFMIKKCCGNDVACICEVVACNLCTYSDRWKYVSGSSKSAERFLCPSHTLALIFVDLWSRVVWSRLWHRYYRIICANVGKKPARNSDIFHHRLQLVYNLQRPILYDNLIRYLFSEQFLSFRNLILT